MARLATIVGVLSLPFTAMALFLVVVIPLASDLSYEGNGEAFFWYALVAMFLLSITIGAFWYSHSQRKSAKGAPPGQA